MIRLSPNKFWGPNGAGRPDGVHVLPLPDMHRYDTNSCHAFNNCGVSCVQCTTVSVLQGHEDSVGILHEILLSLPQL